MSTSDKLLAVFGLFTLEEPEWTAEAAAERLGLAMSTTYRFFKSLTRAGLISTVSPGRYVLGPATVQLDRQTRLLDPLIRVAQPIMQGVAGGLHLPGSILLCRLFRKQVMCIHQEFVERPASAVSYGRGRPMPLYRGAAPKVIPVSLPARPVRAFYSANQADMAAAGFAPDWNAVKAALRRLRNARVGVPLHNASGAVDASLGLVLPDELSNPQRLHLISAALDAAARKLDASLLRAINAPSARSIEARPAGPRAPVRCLPRRRGCHPKPLKARHRHELP